VTDISADHARTATVGDYFALLKPRVMSLVVFTALVGYVCAPGAGDATLGFAAILALAVGAGASGALNMWYDADIDARMARTAGRPVPSGRVAGDEALGLGVALSILSVLTMWMAANLLAAALLAFTIFFYAVVYTMWLKRRTPQNIVIGGLAGALPPAIAWAAKTGSLTLDPILLVAIIFMWTPPHFWALALTQSRDYASAGVPMLPVTHGAKATRAQIVIYAVLLAPLAYAPVLTGLGGPIYAGVAMLGGAAMAALSILVARSRAGDAAEGGDIYVARAENKPALRLFVVSILYLFALFAALLVERVAGLHP
jgi:heme o synthase